MATTTIQITEDLKEVLAQRKMYDKETYEEVIMDLLEDSMELSVETKKEIEGARKEVASGKFYTLEQIEKGMKK